ncbi:MAG: hypothetical protein HZB65_03465 [Candidatus Aenigmarchaeota archaeon]|nr:hypothetical protein [Candidatus Aenigmarchaeota archaeon]
MDIQNKNLLTWLLICGFILALGYNANKPYHNKETDQPKNKSGYGIHVIDHDNNANDYLNESFEEKEYQTEMKQHKERLFKYWSKNLEYYGVKKGETR